MRGVITSQILVAGIGNIFLGDDGFGPEVMRHVPQHVAGPRVRVVDYGIRGMHLAYDLLDGCDALVLVDALPDRGAPGTAARLRGRPRNTVGAESVWMPTRWIPPPCSPASPRSAARRRTPS